MDAGRVRRLRHDGLTDHHDERSPDRRPRLRWSFVPGLVFMLLPMGPVTLPEPPVTALALSPDGSEVVMGSQGGLEVGRCDLLQSVHLRLETQLSNVHDLRFSPDGQFLAIAGGSPGESGVVEIRDWPSRGLLESHTIHSDVVLSLAWLPGQTRIVSASAKGECRIWDVASGRCDRVFEGHAGPVLSVALLPGNVGRVQVISTSADGTVQIWQPESGVVDRILNQHQSPVNAAWIRSAADRSRQAELLTAGEDGTVRFWYPEVGRLVRFAKLESTPRTVIRDHQSGRIFAGCDDGAVRELDQKTMAVIRQWDILPGRIHELIWCSDSGSLVAAGVGGVRKVAVE